MTGEQMQAGDQMQSKQPEGLPHRGAADPGQGRRREWAVRRIPAGASLVAAVLAVLAALGVGGMLLEPAGTVLPIDPSAVDGRDAAISAVALLALSVGLWRGKKIAWYMGIAVFGSAMVLQLVVLGHTIAGSLALLCLLALALGRRHYQAGTNRSMLPLIAFSLGLGAGLVVAQAVLIDLLTGQTKAVIDTLSAWLAFDDPSGLGPMGESVLIDALALASRVFLALAALVLLRAVAARRSGPAERALADELGRLHAVGALVPFQFGRGTEPFLGSDGSGLVVYGQAGRTMVVLGDAIGPKASADTAFLEFLKYSAECDGIPTVYQASEPSRHLLVDAGLHPFRVGQEAIIDVATFGLEGSKRANLRHTVTRAKKGGLTAAWHPDGLPPEEFARVSPGMVAMDAAWQAKAGPRMTFTIGQFSPDDLTRVGVAVAVDADGEPAAFATFRRTDSAGGWVLDLIRRKQGSVPGALEYCVAEAALGMKAAGATELSLGLAPLTGLNVHSAERYERMLAIGARAVKRWYDVEGLAFFKDKFNPRWEPRYGAVQHPWHLIAFAVALLRLHLAGPGGSLLVAGRAAVATAFSTASPR